MRRTLLYLSACITMLAVHYHVQAQAQHPTKAFANHKDELYFIENAGQVTDQYGKHRTDIQYKVSMPGMSLFIGNGQLHYQWSKTPPPPATDKRQVATKLLQTDTSARTEMYRMDVTLAGANTNAVAITEQPQQYYEQYLGQHTTTAHAVNKITYKNIYPHIDWVLYIKDNKVEYDFVVHRGGRVQDIQLQYSGANSLDKTGTGGIAAITPMGNVTELQPYSYQQEDGQTIATTFKVKNNKVSFDVAPHKGTLVIDPTLQWATYYGGTGADQGNGVACDTVGNVYMAGVTSSTTNIATTGGYQNILHNTFEYTSFLTKFNAVGARIWATYFGASATSGITAYNYANAVACDKLGNVYITGNSLDSNITITSGAFQVVDSGLQDAYIAKFNGAGSLQWATYYGGSGIEQGLGIACDNNNNIFVTGSTSSSHGMATTGSAQNSLGGGIDVFVAKFNSSGARQWGTYFGGSNNEQANGITCDTAGNIYIAGETNGSGFPTTTGCYQNSYGGGTYDGFVTKFSNTGVLKWSTFYGGGDIDIAAAITCDGVNAIYITGVTYSTYSIASASSFQSNLAGTTGSNNAMLVKFDSTGSRVWGTYFGSTFINGTAITCDTGSVYFAGGVHTANINVATSDAYQSAAGGGTTDGFFEQFSKNGSQLWGTYYGGNDYDAIYGATTDKKGHIYICGATASTFLYLPNNSFQLNYGGGAYDAFLAKFTTVDTVVYFSVPFAQTCESAGTTITLPYHTTFPFHTGNTFTAQLSDSTGSFANAINIGTTSATTAGNITCTIPAGTPSSTLYRFRLIASSPADTSIDDGYNVTIINTALTSNSPVCKGDTLKMTSANTNSAVVSRWYGPGFSNTVSKNMSIPNTQYSNAGIYTDSLLLGTCGFKTNLVATVKYSPTPLPTYNGPVCLNNNINLASNDTNVLTTYMWTGPNSFYSAFKTPQITSAVFADTGYYRVVATVNGCSTTDSIRVVVQQSLSYLTKTGKDTLCVGGTLALGINTTTPNIAYAWTGPASFNASTQSISISPVVMADSGTYHITASKNGCTSYVDSIKVVIHPLPQTPTVSSNSPRCVGDTMKLRDTITATGNVVYNWTGPVNFPGVQNPVITNITAADSGDYIGYAVVNGCSSVGALMHFSVLLPPSGNTHTANSPCLGDSLKLVENSNTTGVSYSWTGPNSFTANIKNPGFPSTTTSSGKYKVTITAPNGCVAHDSITVATKAVPAVPVANSNSPVCVGDSISFTASDVSTGVTYSWSGGNAFSASGATPHISTSHLYDSGYYIVKATLTSDLCYATDTILVTVNAKPAPQTFSYNPMVCSGSPISIIPGYIIAGAVYNWAVPGVGSVSGSNVFIANSSTANSGSYSLYTQSNGCKVYDTVSISVHQSPAVPVLTSNPVCAKDTLKVNATSDTGTVVYNWMGPNGTSFNTPSFVIPLAPAADSGTYMLSVTQNGCTVYDTIVAVVKVGPTLALSLSNNPICAGGSVNMRAGTTMSPVWTGPNGFLSTVSNPSIINAVPADSGMYVVTASFNGCGAKDSILLQVNNTPFSPAINTNSPVCAGDTIKITGTPLTTGVTYNWTGPAGYTVTNQNVAIPGSSPANAGSYYLQINNGCITYDTFNIAVTPRPAIYGAGSNSPVCNGTQLMLMAGSISPGSFTSWTGPAGFNSFQPNALVNNMILADSGNYVLHAINLGCTSTDTIHVSVDGANIAYTTNSPVCAGDTLKFTGSTTTTGATINWTTPTSATVPQVIVPNATTANAGTYILNVTDNICVIHDTVTAVVKPLPATPAATSNSPLCAGNQLSLTASPTTVGVSYKWTFGSTVIATTQNTTVSNVTSTNSGVYTVRATLNNCVSPAATTSVIVNPLPTATVTSNSPVCLGSNLDFITTAAPGTTFHWSGPNNFISGLQNPSINNTTAAAGGSYSLLLSLNGCTNTVVVPVIITSNPAPAVTVVVPNDTVCKNDNVTFTAVTTNAGAAPTYAWWVNSTFTGKTTRTYTTSALAEGDVVKCIVQGNGTCQSTSAVSGSVQMHVVLSHPPPVTVTVYPQVYTPGVLTTFTAITPGSSKCLTYQWKKNGVDIAGATSSSYESYNLNKGDKISLYIHSTCACTNPDTLLTNAIGLGVNNITIAGSYRIYPNPAQDEVTIEGIGNTAQLEVYDMNGKQLWVKPIQFNSGSAKVHLALPAGIYTMHLVDDKGVNFIERLVVLSN